MSLPTYVEYKKTGLPWQLEAPSHWNGSRVRFVAELNPSKREVSAIDRDTAVSFLPMDAIGDDGSIKLDETRLLSQVENGYTYFRDDDVVIAKITPCFENGKGAVIRGLLGGVGFGTTELIVVRPRPAKTTSEYLGWLFASPTFRNVAEGAMYGAGGQKRVPDDFVRDFSMAFPPIEEQSAIAAFLDRETGKIDALIAEQEKLLTLLAEKRQATISHAVTRGLNRNAPMKDSGVPWLGGVPAHWELKRIKDAGCEVVDCKNRTPEVHVDGDYFVVRTSCVKNGEFNPEEGFFTDEANFLEWTTKGRPQVGDVLFTREAPAGEACLAPKNIEFCLGQRMMYLRPQAKTLSSDFLLYTIYSSLVRERISLKSKGSTVGHLRVGEVGELPLLLPPLEEQNEIVVFLAAEIDRLDSLAFEARRSRNLLKERRSALIAAAVTGKIDVRRAA